MMWGMATLKMMIETTNKTSETATIARNAIGMDSPPPTNHVRVVTNGAVMGLHVSRIVLARPVFGSA